MPEFERSDILIQKLSSGVELSIPVFTFVGKDKQAPSVYIQANIHGAEIQGNAVIYQLLGLIQEQKLAGNLTLVPSCNPSALLTKLGESTLGRFEPTTGENWNRGYLNCTTQIDYAEFVQEHKNSPWDKIKPAFRQKVLNVLQQEMEQDKHRGIAVRKKLCLNLQMLASQADLVLDLHTAPQAVHYVYCPESAVESAKQFAIENLLTIPPDFAGALDEATYVPWHTLKTHFAKAGRTDIPLQHESFTIELGNEESINMAQALEQAWGILNYLKYKQVLVGEPASKIGNFYIRPLQDFVAYHAEDGGFIEYLVHPGESVKKGQPLYRILSFNQVASLENYKEGLTTYYAYEDSKVIYRSSFAVANEGALLYQVLCSG